MPSKNKTIKQITLAGARSFKSLSATPFLDAELLAAHALGQDRGWLFQHPEFAPSPARAQKIQQLFQKRKKHHPVAHLIGRREFWGLNFTVSPQALIPRPATELIVEQALKISQKLPVPSKNLIIDVGTGSGCIIIALAHELLAAQRQSLETSFSFIAQDQSATALKVAHQNLQKHQLEKIIQLEKANLLSNWIPKTGRRGRRTTHPFANYHNLIITANLPYLSPVQYQKTAPDLKKEPRRSLLAADHGLALIKRLISQIQQINEQNPDLAIYALIEFGLDQKKLLQQFLKTTKINFSARFSKDLEGHWRALTLSNGPARIP